MKFTAQIPAAGQGAHICAFIEYYEKEKEGSRFISGKWRDKWNRSLRRVW